MSKVDDLIEREDWGALIAMTMNAHFKAEEGVFCSCETPDVVGRDLMCGTCSLEVKAQRERRERELKEPHPYVAGRLDDIGMCDFCTRWKDDPIHALCATPTEGEES